MGMMEDNDLLSSHACHIDILIELKEIHATIP